MTKESAVHTWDFLPSSVLDIDLRVRVMAEKTKLNCLSFEKKREILALVDKKNQ